jgi:hypothetical protein
VALVQPNLHLTFISEQPDRFEIPHGPHPSSLWENGPMR